MDKRKIKEKVDVVEIKKVAREYIERIFKSSETLQGASNDEYIDCPRCGRKRAIEYQGKGYWHCLWKDCLFAFPPDLKPPSPTEVKMYWQQKQKDKDIERFLINDAQIKKSKARLALERMEYYDKCMSGEIPPVNTINQPPKREKKINIEKEVQKLKDFFESQEWHDIQGLIAKLGGNRIKIPGRIEQISARKRIGHILIINQDATLRLSKRRVVKDDWSDKNIIEEKDINYREAIQEFTSFKYIKEKVEQWINDAAYLYMHD